jgi:hypothetical protein
MMMGGGNKGNGMMQPSIILLKEGTDTSQGKAQLISNINACGAVADIVRSTLGPRGMDKLIHKDGKVIISNDGATIMKNLEIVHPAALTLVDIARSQDSEVRKGKPTCSSIPNMRPCQCSSSSSICRHPRAEFLIPSPPPSSDSRTRISFHPPSFRLVMVPRLSSSSPTNS